MNREQKSHVIDSLKNKLIDSSATFLIEYKGLSVSALQGLRRELRPHGGSFKVAKARLMKRAATDVPAIDGMTENFKNQVGLVFAQDNVPEIAKTVHLFAKKNGSCKILVGYMDQQVIPVDAVVALATLPPRDVLLAQLMGVMQAPTTNLARVLQLMVARLVFVLQKIAEQKGKSS